MRRTYLGFFLERYADAYREELTAFIDAVVAGRPVSPTVADGIAALRIAEAAAQSARTGRTVHL
jgi:myo-inositol 2-dehydrogenase/D-chiro-inositol 1-dehydrogenase